MTIQVNTHGVIVSLVLFGQYPFCHLPNETQTTSYKEEYKQVFNGYIHHVFMERGIQEVVMISITMDL